MPQIRTVLFDADGVVQHSSDEGIATQLERIMGFVPTDLDAFKRAVFHAERSALVGEVDFAEALEPVLATWGASGGARRLAVEWWCSIEVDRALLALIGQLRQTGLFCALASNQQRYRATYMEEGLSYSQVFDRSFYSYRLGLLKPDVRYFNAIAAELSCASEEVLFIDDTEANVAAARLAGFQAAQFVHPRSELAVAAMIELLRGFSIELVA